ncbi:hypothetical protein D9M71_655700 [compost metagenome]
MLSGLAQGQVDPQIAQQRMCTRLEWQYPVVAQAVLATPDQHVTMTQANTLGGFFTGVPAEQKHRGQP